MQTQTALLQADKIAMDIALSTEQYNRMQAEKQTKDEIKKYANQHKIDWK